MRLKSIGIALSLGLVLGTALLYSKGSNGSKKQPAIPKAWLGISFLDIPAEKMPTEYRQKKFVQAVQIQQVFPQTSADQAGLKVGDYILQVNGAPLLNRMTLVDSVGKKSVGEMVTLVIGRDKKIVTQQMALSPRPSDLQSITKLLIGTAAPELQGKYYSNAAGSLKENQGKVVLLDFWATWCGPCLMSLPVIEELYKQYQSQGLQVIGVSSESLKTLEDFQAKKNLSYPLFNDIARLTQGKYNAYAYPTLVYIDKTGTIQRIETGFHKKGHIESRIKELLGVGQ